MKALVIYDSKYGNTRAVAASVAEALGPDVKARPVEDVEDEDLRGLDLLVVGSPTQGGRATKETQALLKAIPDGALRDTKVAAFDTRIDAETCGFFVRGLMRVIGFAAPKIDAALRARGGNRVAEPAGFEVTGNEGPLAVGEIERAARWAGSFAKERVAV